MSTFRTQSRQDFPDRRAYRTVDIAGVDNTPAPDAGAKSGDRACFRRQLTALAFDTHGTIVVLAAFLFPIVIGAFGLGAETAFWYLTQRKLQHAADLSVHAAGARLRAGDALAEVTAAATNIAVRSGYNAGIGTVAVNMPPTSGAFAGNTSSVEVVLEETRIRWFSALFNKGPVKIRARAVSRLNGGATACILALSRTAPGAVTVSGSTAVTLNNCDVASNSMAPDAFLVSGTSAQITTGCVYAVGQAVTTPGLTLTTCSSVKINSPIVRDPYAGIPEPVVMGPCKNRNVGHPNNPTTLNPTDIHPSGVKSMRFCSGLDIKGVVTFNPGLYIIEGGSFDFNGGVRNDPSVLTAINGTGVTVYMANTSNLTLNGNVRLNVAAPTSGPFSGILFFGARNATAVTNKISGTVETTLQGAVYAPASLIEYTGNSTGSGGCTQVVGRLVTLTGNSTVKSDCATAGTKTIYANEKVLISE